MTIAHEDTFGVCDDCGKTYVLTDKDDHCTECGKCAEHCDIHVQCEWCHEWFPDDMVSHRDVIDRTLCHGCWEDSDYHG